MGSILDLTSSDLLASIQQLLNLISILLIIYLVIFGLHLLGRLAKSLVLICGTCNHCCGRVRNTFSTIYSASKRGSAFVSYFIAGVRDLHTRIVHTPTKLSATVNFFDIIQEVEDVDNPV